jgi:hypothetical protein
VNSETKRTKLNTEVGAQRRFGKNEERFVAGLGMTVGQVEREGEIVAAGKNPRSKDRGYREESRDW